MLSGIVDNLLSYEGVDSTDVGVRKASLLDLPFVFELLLEGAFFGSFSEAFMLPTGTFRLLYMVFKLWFNQYTLFRKNYHPAALLMLIKGKKEIGFLYLEEIMVREKSNKHLVLSLMSVMKSYRNQKIGTKVVGRIFDSMPVGATMVAGCTKYSSVMQKILRKLKFKAVKNKNIGMIEFTKTKLQV